VTESVSDGLGSAARLDSNQILRDSVQTCDDEVAEAFGAQLLRVGLNREKEITKTLSDIKSNRRSHEINYNRHEM
jgi:hypothetical protein